MMQIRGLDEIDNRLLTLLKENARASYSELGAKVGLSRVAVKNRMEAMEEAGLIRGYEVKLASGKADQSIGFLLNVCTKPQYYDSVVEWIAAKKMIRKVYSVSGECKICAVGAAPNTESLDAFYRAARSFFTDVRSFSFDVIASTLKDVDGGVDYEGTGKKESADAGGADH